MVEFGCSSLLFPVAKCFLDAPFPCYPIFFLIPFWLIHVDVLGWLASLFPNVAKLHISFPDTVVMSVNVVTWKKALHLLSCCSSLFWPLYLGSRGSTRNMSPSLWAVGSYFVVCIISPLKVSMYFFGMLSHTSSI